MKVVFKNHNNRLILNLIIFITLLLTAGTTQICVNLNNQGEKLNRLSNNDKIFISQGPTNDTTAPIVTFIQPENNNTIIRLKSYNIIVNITDENPPLFGNVTLQISNYTHSLFNATMIFDGGEQWSFSWDNISLYPNQFYTTYIIQIVAVDSSSDYNLGTSEEFYIYLNVPGDSPGVLNIFLYLIIVCLLFAGIVVYLNRKILKKVTGEKAEGDNGPYEY